MAKKQVPGVGLVGREIRGWVGGRVFVSRCGPAGKPSVRVRKLLARSEKRIVAAKRELGGG